MRPHRKSPATGPGLAPGSPAADLLLVCEAWSTGLVDGRWHFTLETSDGRPVLEAGDDEPGDLNRLSLLAALRGLEAIDGPSSVVLISQNRYLIHSLTESLPRWRARGFVWEHFGRQIDVQNADLWRRVDRALRIHRVEACLVSTRAVSTGPVSALPSTPSDSWVRVDSPHAEVAPPRSSGLPKDRLRRWLLGTSQATPRPVTRRRFTAADLAEVT